MSEETFGTIYLKTLSQAFQGFMYKALDPDSEKSQAVFALPAKDMDRDKAEADFNSTIGRQKKDDGKSKGSAVDDAEELSKLTEALAVHQSTQRARRDVAVAGMTHKEIVLSMLRGAYGISVNVEQQLKRAEAAGTGEK